MSKHYHYSDNKKALIEICDIETCFDVIYNRMSELTDEQLDMLDFELYIEKMERMNKRGEKDYDF